jgi:hypothetical protein
MDKKLEYMTRLLKKMSAKGIETYVITRLWHLLDNDGIKLVPQQYVRHSNGQYSLTDIYLPQFNIHVEVNESGHYHSEAKIAKDALRERNIISASGHEIKTIDCTRPMAEIHSQIDEIISAIQEALKVQLFNKTFQQWQPEFEYKANFYKNYKTLNVKDNVALETIEQICELFGTTVPRRGFLRKGAVPYPPMGNTIIWWPGSYNANWQNSISPDGSTIIERAADLNFRKSHAEGIINNPHHRITFFKDTDVLGYTYYRFKGVFDLNPERSNISDGLFWNRIQDHVSIISNN